MILKRFIATLTAITIGLTSVPVFADVYEGKLIDTNNGITVISQGVNVEFSVEPQIIEGATYIPIRDVFEEVGTVDWNDETRTITIAVDDRSINIDLTENILIDTEGEQVPLSDEPVIVEGTTLLPLRKIAEALGLIVSWNEEARTVLVLNPHSVEEAIYAFMETPCNSSDVLNYLNSVGDSDIELIGYLKEILGSGIEEIDDPEEYGIAFKIYDLYFDMLRNAEDKSFIRSDLLLNTVTYDDHNIIIDDNLSDEEFWEELSGFESPEDVETITTNQNNLWFTRALLAMIQLGADNITYDEDPSVGQYIMLMAFSRWAAEFGEEQQ